jgi:hypothetical protein
MGTAVRTFTAVTLPSIALHLLNRDDPRYKEIPAWQKNLFWIVMPKRISKEAWSQMSADEKADAISANPVKSGIYRIPKPFEIGMLFGSLPERMLEYFEEKDPKAFESWAKGMIEGASPGFIPTAALPLIENLANWNLFTDRPIVSEGLKELEPRYQAQPYTSELSKKIGDLINYPPAKIDNLIRGWTGGLGMLAVDAIDQAIQKTGVVDLPPAPKWTLADVPGVRGFVVRFPSANTESVTTFYDYYEKSRKASRTFNYLMEKSPEKGGIYASKQGYWALKAPLIKVMSEELSKGRDIIRGLYENKELTPEQKRKAIDVAYFDMIEKANSFVNSIDADPLNPKNQERARNGS